ncbi:M20 family metallopeptidase [Chthonobacter rhizosphaerae]|uniref:M20 family metallopeptidase n=1 Tax=Chthonobacter rhizosphaerae TaxID=2735553 RepID=UPI0015EECAAE|nr:ArgE/DapE family deacylase [Chthonobacter rhizosphaerae]
MPSQTHPIDPVRYGTEPAAPARPIAAAPSAVLSAVDAHAEAAIALLSDLVAINSINPLFPGIDRAAVIGGETRCTDLLGERLAALGAEIHRVAPDPERTNVVAVLKGAGGGRSLILNGHLDTVAPFTPERWISGDPWKPTLKDGRLYGLGSTDMKGGLVSVVLALQAIRAAGVRLKGDVQVHAVVGEETMSHELGTSAVLEAGFTADAAIVVEPSSQPFPLSVAPVSAGNFNLEITVRGRATHAGNRGAAIRPGGEGASAGVNAVEKAILVVQALQTLEEEWGQTKSHPAFPTGFFSLVPGVFHGDAGVPSVGYMADKATVGYLVWYPPGDTADAVKAEIERHVGHAAALDPWLRENPPMFDWKSNWPVADTAEDHPLVRTLVDARAAVLGPIPRGRRETWSLNAVTDASFLEAKGIPTTVFGPGNLRFAHAVDEHIEIQDLVNGAKVLALAILGWCGVAD